MSDPCATSIDRLDLDELLGVVATLPPSSVALSGWPGSGLSLVTEVLGEEVYVGKLPVAWTTPVLIVTGEHLTDGGVDMLRRLGVDDPYRTVTSLGIGEALVVRRG